MRAVLGILCLLAASITALADGVIVVGIKDGKFVTYTATNLTRLDAYRSAIEQCANAGAQQCASVVPHFSNTCVSLYKPYGIHQGYAHATGPDRETTSSEAKTKCEILHSGCHMVHFACDMQDRPGLAFIDKFFVYFPWARYVPYFYYVLGAGVLLVIFAVITHAAKRRRERAEARSRFNRRPVYDHSPPPETPPHAGTQPLRPESEPAAPPPERRQAPQPEYPQKPPPQYPEAPPPERPSYPPPTYPEAPKRRPARDVHAEMREKILGPRKPVERRPPEIAEESHGGTTIVRSQTYEI